MPTLVRSLLVSLALAPASLAGDVHVVDATGAGDFLDVSDAIAAASFGDTILVRSGTYVGDVLVDRPVSLVADVGATPVLDGSLRIISVLRSDEEVTVSGFEIDQRVVVTDCDAHVVLQDVRAGAGTTRTTLTIERETHLVQRSPSVVFHACVLQGTHGGQAGHSDPGGWGEHGLLVRDARVSLYGSIVRGGNGAIVGNGHYASAPGGHGGDGLVVASGGEVWNRGSVLEGGDAGFDWFCGYPGCWWNFIEEPGEDVTLLGGTLDDMGASLLHFRLDGTSAGGASPTLAVTGPAGSDVYLLTDATSGFRPFNASFGVLHLVNTHAVLPVGTLDANGTLEVPLAPFDLAGEESGTRRVQLFGSGGAGRMLSHPRSWTVIR